jgi:hypothetical protein
MTPSEKLSLLTELAQELAFCVEALTVEQSLEMKNRGLAAVAQLNQFLSNEYE